MWERDWVIELLLSSETYSLSMFLLSQTCRLSDSGLLRIFSLAIPETPDRRRCGRCTLVAGLHCRKARIFAVLGSFASLPLSRFCLADLVRGAADVVGTAFARYTGVLRAGFTVAHGVDGLEEVEHLIPR